jgi:hypothetical protein
MSILKYILKEEFNEDRHTDNIYRLYDLESEITEEELSKILDYYENPDKKITFQHWSVIPKRLLIKTWEDFMKYGFVRNKRSVDKMVDIIMYNTAKMRVNNIMAGHESYFFDADVLERAGMGDTTEWSEFSNKYEDVLEDYLSDPNQGHQLAISDYGLPQIEKILNDILGEDDYTKILIGIDKILNIIHMRSDLASYFVEGGSDTLSELSRKEEE